MSLINIRKLRFICPNLVLKLILRCDEILLNTFIRILLKLQYI